MVRTAWMRQGISDDQFAPVCVVVDKLDKIGEDAVTAELVGLGVKEATARTIIQVRGTGWRLGMGLQDKESVTGRGRDV